MTLTTARLTLHAVQEDEARRIAGRTPGAEGHWAPDYPFGADLAGIGAFLHAVERHGPQEPFGYYRVTVLADGLAIGGIGFKGSPDDGVVEVGYGLVPSARSRGYATEALLAFVALAATLGVTTVRADTDPDNVASQRVLEKSGFSRTGATASAFFYELRIGSPAA